MAREKVLAGHAVRRLRRRPGLTQAAMAEMLGDLARATST